MKLTRQERLSGTTASQLRTLHTLQADHLEFATKGKGDTKQAKNCNNVIRPYMLDVPLAQVNYNLLKLIT